MLACWGTHGNLLGIMFSQPETLEAVLRRFVLVSACFFFFFVLFCFCVFYSAVFAAKFLPQEVLGVKAV